MTTVYVLARKQGATFGHGDYGHELVLADDYFAAHPAFASEDGAAGYLAALAEWRRASLLVVPLVLRP